MNRSSQIALPPPRLVQLSIRIHVYLVRQRRTEGTPSISSIRMQERRLGAKRPLNVTLTSSLFFIIGVIVGGVFCDHLFPLPIDWDGITDVIAGVIEQASSSFQYHGLLAYYTASLFTIMFLMMSVKHVRAA